MEVWEGTVESMAVNDNQDKTLLKQRFSEKDKLAFMATFLFGILMHGYRISNSLWNHDVLWSFYGIQSGVKFARPFVSIGDMLGGIVGNMPWINGILTLCYLGAVTILLCRLFRITERKSIILLSGIVVGFPTIPSLFAYIHITDVYVLSILVAVFSIYCINCLKKQWFAILAGGLLLCFSIGLYQANLAFAILCVILFLINRILCGIDNKEFGKLILKNILSGILGAVLYVISFKIALVWAGRVLTDYMGIDQVGKFEIKNIPSDVIKCYKSFFQFFIGYSEKLQFFSVLNIITFVLIGILLIGCIWKKKLYKKLVQFAFIFLSVLLFPCICYCLYFTSPGLGAYHRLMEYSLIFVYIILVFGADQIKKKNHIWKLVAEGTLVLVIYDFIMLSNIAYQDMQQSYEYNMALLNRITDRIEQTDKFSQESRQIMVTGVVTADYDGPHWEAYGPELTGISVGPYMSSEYHYAFVLGWYFGYDFEVVDADIRKDILRSAEYVEMSEWPLKDSVKVIDGVVIIKFEQEAGE